MSIAKNEVLGKIADSGLVAVIGVENLTMLPALPKPLKDRCLKPN